MKREDTDQKNELEALRAKVRELEETLEAIHAGEVDAIIVSKDDTRRVYTLDGADHPYRALVENIQEGALTLSHTGMILYTNTRFAEMVQLPTATVFGSSLFDHICPEHRTEVGQALHDIGRKASRIHIRIRQGSGTLPALISMSPLSSDEDTKISVIVTDRKDDEDCIRLQARMLDAVGDAVITVDTRNRIIFWNEAATTIYGSRSEEVMGRDVAEVVVSDLSRNDAQKIAAQIASGRSWSGENRVRHRDGYEFPVHVIASPLLNDDGNLIAIISASHDISKQKRADEDLVASLQEKDVLLREIHHRVKNNLQLMSGLLDMTRTRVPDESTRSILTDMMLKIQTMSQIHKRLYESTQFGKISLTGQIQDQICSLSDIFSHKGHEIRCMINPEEVFLPVDQALPCALVVNEILSNAYKHAFKGRAQGAIEILAREDDGRISIAIRDDGIGLPADFDIRCTDSLGLKLIRTLVQHQLKGAITFESRNGTEIRLEFPVWAAGTVI